MELMAERNRTTLFIKDVKAKGLVERRASERHCKQYRCQGPTCRYLERYVPRYVAIMPD
jgi:hypothetical protein